MASSGGSSRRKSLRMRGAMVDVMYSSSSGVQSERITDKSWRRSNGWREENVCRVDMILGDRLNELGRGDGAGVGGEAVGM